VTGHRDEPVTVGVGLQDRHDGGRRHRGLDRAEVHGQAGQVHLDDGRPQHAEDGRRVRHRIMLGSQRDSHGNATRMASRMTSAHMKGSTPLNTVPVLTSGRSVRSTNMFMPTGGLMRPISTTHTMMMPNQMGSNPSCTITGKNTGIVSRIIDSSSMAVPSST